MAAKDFFRPEAIAAQQRRWLGEIHIAQSLSLWTYAGIASAATICLILFLSFGHYTRRERVTGQLVPTTGLINITATESGRITRVLVREGQQIRKGDPLLEISGEVDSEAFGGTLARVNAQLESQRQRLKDDLSIQQRSQAQQRDSLQDKRRLLQAQLQEIEGQLAIQQRQVDSARDLLKRIAPLRKEGYVSAFQIQQQESTMLAAQTQYKAMSGQRLELHQQLASVDQQLSQLPLDASIQRHETERKLSDADSSLAQNEVQRALLLRAPQDGVVSALLPKPGQSLSTGQPVLSILPRGARLEAQLLVPSRAAGFIEAGDRVVLRYQAYPYQKFGQQYGRVTAISRNALAPAEVTALTGQQVSEPRYRIDVALEKQQIRVYGKSESLRAGMTLDADILLERRRLMEWLFEPLYGLSNQYAARETDNGGR